MNKLRKGKGLERKVELYLISLGYQVYKPTWNRWAKQKDVFNMFDLIAISEKDLKFIQVKYNSSQDYKGRLQEWCKKYGKVKVGYELWVKNEKKKTVKVFTMKDNGMDDLSECSGEIKSGIAEILK